MLHRAFMKCHCGRVRNYLNIEVYKRGPAIPLKGKAKAVNQLNLVAYDLKKVQLVMKTGMHAQ